MQEKSLPSEPRTKFLDYDARREPKTDHFCIKCQKDLNPKKPRRIVLLAGMMALHPSDYDMRRRIHHEIWPIGMCCAKKLGMEWTISYEQGLATNKKYEEVLQRMKDNSGILSLLEHANYKSEVYDLTKLGLVRLDIPAGCFVLIT